MLLNLETLVARITDLSEAVKQAGRSLTRAIWLEPSTGRVRATVDTVTTVTTVSTVSNITNIGGFDAKQGLINATERAAWALTVRPRIT